MTVRVPHFSKIVGKYFEMDFEGNFEKIGKILKITDFCQLPHNKFSSTKK